MKNALVQLQKKYLMVNMIMLNRKYIYKLLFSVFLGSRVVSGVDLSYLTEMTGSPLVYSDEVGEYQIVWTVSSDEGSKIYKFPIKYDPFTGEKLNSFRKSKFLVPNDAEVSRLNEELEAFESLSDAVEHYGKPDKVWENSDDSIQYDFNSYFKTINLSIHVDASGEILYYVYHPKEIKTNHKPTKKSHAKDEEKRKTEPMRQ